MPKLASNSKPERRHIQIGDEFDRLTIQAAAGRDKWYRRKWLCVCKCGTAKVIREDALLNEKTHSCGCLSKENAAAVGRANSRHGATRIKGNNNPRIPPEYKAWQEMRYRCENPSSPDYLRYGGRGINVCDRWQSFENFLADVGPRPSAQHSLDRFPNNNGNYEPSNVRWATKKEQARNTRRNKLITIKGETRCLAEWAETANLLPDTILARIRKEWPENRWLEPARTQVRRKSSRVAA